ncbi:MAG: phosphodiester glycosidase family protein [Lachnospiraceae bacterium]|nr:phosphodiester glycosidase family protein [Lachnospiraceae bacterium]
MQKQPRLKNLYYAKELRVILPLFLICLCWMAWSSPAQAAKYVKQSNTTVCITSNQTGWIQLYGDWYYYDSNGRLRYGSIKYKGNYYYSAKDGKRVTGFVTRNGSKYYYSKKTGIMLRSRWLTTTSGKKYYLNESGKALTKEWLTLDGKKYYFNANSRMVTGWKKIKGYYYYFDSDGVLATSKWVGIYYVNENGQRTSETRSVVSSNKAKTKYTYKSATLNIELLKKSTHGVSYWVAHIKTSSSDQLKSALSYGTYGGTRQTTSSAVSSNGGVIGINGSAFSYSTGQPSPLGMCIKNGVIYGDYTTSYTVMAVKWDGTIYTPAQGLSGADLLAEGVKDTYNFGPVLISGGVAQPSIAETQKYYPRTAIGMVAKNDYVIVVTDTGNYTGLNHSDLVSIFQSYGCQYAYNLDGGGSSTLYFNGQVMNELINDYERPCADFLYFTE